MAKPKQKFIQKAIKRPGRLHRLLGKSEDEEITEAELNMLERRAKRMGGKRGKSLLAAVNLARRLKKMARRRKRR